MRATGEAGGRLHANREVTRFVISHLFAVIAEWAALIGLLVYTLDRAGTRAAGFASLIALAPYLLLSATTARLSQRHPPARVRVIALLAQAVGYGAAGACALMDGPVILAIAATSLAFTGATAMRPAGAVILPAWVLSTRELTATNVSVGRCESVAVLLGPLMATGLLALRGGGAVLAGCAVIVGLAVVVAAFDVGRGPPAAWDQQHSCSGEEQLGRSPGSRIIRSLGAPFAGVVSVARRPGAGGVLGAVAGQYLMVGAFDIILVVIASEHEEFGKGGAGILGAIFGAGAFVSTMAASGLAKRQRLGPIIVGLLVLMSGVCILFGATVGVVAAVISLPLVGGCRSLVDLMSRVLLQRSAPPSQLAEVFGARESVAGAGLLVGSLLAQILIAIWGPNVALFGIGGLFAVLAVMLLRPLRTVDDGADVPVVAMSLLQRIPVFAPLPPLALESVARSAVEVAVPAGAEVIRQGEFGDRFYAVVDGSFDVVRSGVLVRSVERGGGFGEVALLADVPRTATVIATRPGRLLVIESAPFLLAVTGYEQARVAARTLLSGLELDGDIVLREYDAGDAEPES